VGTTRGVFNEIEGVMAQVTGANADPGAVANAAEQHVAGMDPNELSGHLQTAATNLRQNGDTDLAEQIERMVQGGSVDPESLKAAAVAFLRDNPQVLAQFAPPFAQGVLSKLGI